MNEVSKKGIPTTIKGKMRSIKTYLVLAIVDTPARCKMNEIIQFNGFFGFDLSPFWPILLWIRKIYCASWG